MNDKLDDRKIFIWRGPEDANRLTDAVAEKLVTELFNVDGSLFWLDAGRLVPANKNVLRDLITRHFVSVRLANHGTIDAPRWEYDYFSFDFRPEADTSE